MAHIYSLAKMSLEEKTRGDGTPLAESLRLLPDQVDSPSWHRDELERRREQYGRSLTVFSLECPSLSVNLKLRDIRLFLTPPGMISAMARYF